MLKVNLKQYTQRGFNLVEMMIAVAVMGILSVGVSRFTVQINQSVEKTEARMSEYEVVGKMRVVTGNELACTESLKGKTLDYPFPVGEGLKKSDGITKALVVGDSIAGHEITRIEIIRTGPAVSTGFSEVKLEVDIRDSLGNPTKVISVENLVVYVRDTSGVPRINYCHSESRRALKSLCVKHIDTAAVRGSYDGPTETCSYVNYPGPTPPAGTPIASLVTSDYEIASTYFVDQAMKHQSGPYVRKDTDDSKSEGLQVGSVVIGAGTAANHVSSPGSVEAKEFVSYPNGTTRLAPAYLQTPYLSIGSRIHTDDHFRMSDYVTHREGTAFIANGNASLYSTTTSPVLFESGVWVHGSAVSGSSPDYWEADTVFLSSGSRALTEKDAKNNLLKFMKDADKEAVFAALMTSTPGSGMKKLADEAYRRAREMIADTVCASMFGGVFRSSNSKCYHELISLRSFQLPTDNRVIDSSRIAYPTFRSSRSSTLLAGQYLDSSSTVTVSSGTNTVIYTDTSFIPNYRSYKRYYNGTIYVTAQKVGSGDHDAMFRVEYYDGSAWKLAGSQPVYFTASTPKGSQKIVRIPVSHFEILPSTLSQLRVRAVWPYYGTPHGGSFKFGVAWEYSEY